MADQAPRLCVGFVASVSAATFLAGCAPPQTSPDAAKAVARCEQAATREVAFFGPDTKDILEMAASGVDCAKAVVTVSIRPPDGAPRMAFAVPLGKLQFDLDLTKPVTPEALAAFLKAYADGVQLDPGGSMLPEWKANTQGPGFDQGLELSTPYDRDSYEAVRKTRPNMLCLTDSREGSVCYVWDALRASSEIILRNGR